MLRVKEVAARLRVHPATVYRWINEGRIPATRYGQPVVPGAAKRGGGAIRVPEAALVGFSSSSSGTAAFTAVPPAAEAA
ncbi:helix-turn-helix domain-containing protein [Streptomyces sparsogenes]|uniref:helix-turn-helix domain-containing protein n=1 Tax=Streptomyces sparsogenes TaxID=67365 RepID=UPI000978FCAD|nr:helix-turn-helix domain-containing protein [Streptomyces sparsogenes]